MPKLVTPVEICKFPFEIKPGDQIYSVGSCFAENIAAKLHRLGFPLVVNPLGTLYNPVSLGLALSRGAVESRLFLHQGKWRSFSAHGSLSSPHRVEAKARLSQAQEKINEALSQSRILLLTLGTAQVFELVVNGLIVANCHRLPGHLFRRRRLSVNEAVEALQQPLLTWLEPDPSRQVILSVSPVRYLRDGALENSRGKAVLQLACAELEQLNPRIHLFPAYEMLMDELRSYRYYARDLVHPNDLAVDLIWERFRAVVFSAEVQELWHRLDRVATAAEHRFSSDSEQTEFARRNLELLGSLSKSLPEVHLQNLNNHFSALVAPK